MLFDTAVDLYWADKSRRLRGNTLEGYASAIRRHLMPAWSGRELESITHDEVQAWVDSIPTYGAAQKAYKTFRQIYRWIVRKEQLRIWDVTQGIELPQAPVARRDALTAAEERETLRGIVGQPWEAVVLLAAALGLRRCEACGIDWSDIDWRTGWVHVQRGAHWVGGEVVEYRTKTKLSDRWLRLPRFALARLRQIRGHRRSGRVRGGHPHQLRPVPALTAQLSGCRVAEPADLKIGILVGEEGQHAVAGDEDLGGRAVPGAGPRGYRREVRGDGGARPVWERADGVRCVALVPQAGVDLHEHPRADPDGPHAAGGPGGFLVDLLGYGKLDDGKCHKSQIVCAVRAGPDSHPSVGFDRYEALLTRRDSSSKRKRASIYAQFGSSKTVCLWDNAVR